MHYGDYSNNKQTKNIPVDFFRKSGMLKKRRKGVSCMAKRNRIISLVLSAVMIFSLLFSALFVVEDAEHSCVGHDCQICTQISTCLNLFNNISPKPSALSVLAVLLFAVVFSIGFTKESDSFKTLVGLKIKLSN